MTNFTGAKSIGHLAIKIFSITPHSADCERTFSALGWLYGKRRQRLSLTRIQAMAQIRSFYISNIQKELAFYGKALPVNNLQELVATSTFLTEFDDDDPIEHSETETEIEQNLESINFLNIESMVNLNHNAFQDDESDSESEGSQISSNEENYEYDDEPMISNNEGQGVFDFDPTDLVTDLVNVWENSDTENIEDMLNMEMCMDDNLDDILDEDGERDIDSDPEANSENLPIALRKARREFCRS